MRIWTGRANSGKTTAILKEIAECCHANQGKQALIVPELTSHQMERLLAEATQNHGARTAEVLTFSRLADRVLAVTGGLAQQTLTPAGQLLTVQEAARRVQSSLSVWSGLAEKPELLEEAVALIDECKTCAVPSESLFDAMEQCDDDALKEKLNNFAQLLTVYDNLCDNSLPDPRDRLTLLRAKLPESGVLQDTTVYFDGFLSFTPQEIAVIDMMLAIGISVNIAVTCDPKESEIFIAGCKTVKTISRMAKRHNCTVEIISLGDSKISRPAGLALLEREALRAVSKPHPGESTGVQIYTAASLFEECEHAAAYICQRVREEGAAFHEFVVAARNIEPYTAFLEIAMERYHIPIFLAEKPDLLSRPPLALVAETLNAVCNYFQYEDLFACLKTGLTHITWDEIDRLENYVLTWNIRGGAWQREWTEHPDGYGRQWQETDRAYLEQLNALRQKTIAPFVKLREKLKDASCATEQIRALYDFLTEIQAPQRLSDRAVAHEAAGRLQLADEYRQLWEIIVSAMEQFVWVCGESSLPVDRFTQLFRLVLRAYDVGTIPVALDRVTCGDITRVCYKNTKHMILLGVNDGLIPQTPSSASLLNDLDREKLDALGIELSASGTEKLLLEQEIIYRALSCPTDTLLLSWHEHDSSGSVSRPSYLIGVIENLLPDISHSSHTTQTMRDQLQAEQPAVELACEWLAGNRSPAACAAYQYYREDPRVQKASKQNTKRGPVSDPAVIRRLYDMENHKALRLTASRVDTFYSCQFAFFMQYGLKAKPRRTAKLSAMETGTFLHYVLEHALQSLERQDGGAAQAQESTVKQACRAAVRQYIKDNFGSLDNKTARFRYLFSRLVKTAQQVLNNIIDELRVSDFTPIDYEVSFAPHGDLPPVLFTDGDNAVSLTGIADRVDGYIQNGRLYLRIMDYKSGKKAFSLSDIWYGLNMQLIIYLYALKENGLQRYRKLLMGELNQIVPAGVLYVPIWEELPDAPRGVTQEELRALQDKALRRSGLLSDNMELLEAMEHGLEGDGRFIPVSVRVKRNETKPTLTARSAVANLEQFGRLARYTHKKLIEMGQLLQQGKVDASPRKRDKTSSYCDWCEYKAACGFDETAGDRARFLKRLTNQEFWERLKGGDI